MGKQQCSLWAPKWDFEERWKQSQDKGMHVAASRVPGTLIQDQHKVDYYSSRVLLWVWSCYVRGFKVNRTWLRDARAKPKSSRGKQVSGNQKIRRKQASGEKETLNSVEYIWTPPATESSESHQIYGMDEQMNEWMNGQMPKRQSHCQRRILEVFCTHDLWTILKFTPCWPKMGGEVDDYRKASAQREAGP